MRKIELDELKQLQLQILDEVVDFCNQHQIKYFLMAGTLLGAVRHQGYIPWDDDIDIGMLREDYNKFIYLFNKNYNQNNKLYLYNYITNKECIFPFTKVCLKNTIVNERVYSLSNKYGINIDIFPIDGINESPKKIYRNIKFWRRIREFKAVKPNASSFYILFIKKIMHLLCKFISYPVIFRASEKFFIISEQKILQRGNIIWGYGECELVQPEIFDDFIDIKFEGKYYKAPKNYHNWLSAIYGNYMKIPPKNKQIGHNVEAYIL